MSGCAARYDDHAQAAGAYKPTMPPRTLDFDARSAPYVTSVGWNLLTAATVASTLGVERAIWIKTADDG